MQVNVLEDLAARGYSGWPAHSQQKLVLTVGSAVIPCLFHAETSPSLFIDLSNGTYHCAGCNAKGTYTELTDKLSAA